MTLKSDENPEILPPAPDHQDLAPRQIYRSKVYRSDVVDEWIVEPPRDIASTVAKVVFTGVQARHLALTYAYEKFGNARFFPY